MSTTRRKRGQILLLVCGILLLVGGMGVHLGIPSRTVPSMPQVTAGDSTAVEPLWMGGGTGWEVVRVDVWIWSPGVENCSLSLVRPSEYERYVNGTPVAELDALFHTRNQSEYVWESGGMEGMVYLLFVNNNTVQMQ